MTDFKRSLPLSVGLFSLTACPTTADDTAPGGATDPAGDTASDTVGDTAAQTGGVTSEGTTSPTGTSAGSDDSEDSTAVDTTSGETEPKVWAEASGPCAGSGTNALWFDDRDTGFIGCGENADGEGLFTTIDGGETWDGNIRFNEVRIMDIRRGPDGVLYGAGIHQLDGYPVWAFDESGATIDASGLYDPSGTTSQVSQAENIAVTADGRALIDSLTGVAAAYRPAGGRWEEVDSLSEDLLSDPDAIGFQVRRILAHEDAFYSVGSLINDPARVHLPSTISGATFHFATVLLQPETRDGELQDLHVWDSASMIVAGHDQSTRYPLIYVLDG
ncbi:MAG: hypothetical protein AAF721_33825, partial [Myxococcota bacterium]